VQYSLLRSFSHREHASANALESESKILQLFDALVKQLYSVFPYRPHFAGTGLRDSYGQREQFRLLTQARDHALVDFEADGVVEVCGRLRGQHDVGRACPPVRSVGTDYGSAVETLRSNFALRVDNPRPLPHTRRLPP
jgi:hypothetical protein